MAVGLTARITMAREEPGAAGTSAVRGPLVVWADTPWQSLTPDMKPPANPSLSLTLAAARGGIASGLVLVSGASGPVSAQAEELKGPGGTIPVRLRYVTRKRDLGPASWGTIGERQLDAAFDLGRSRFLDALSETPIGDEPIQAVWVTVDVPSTTSPGEYHGKIVVQAKSVAVSVSVANFTVPPLGERRLYVNVHQSPDSVALRYGLEPWSDEHFKMLEPSLKLLGRVGANIMQVPVIGRTYFGQRNGVVVFTRKGEDLVPDFSPFDRYLDLWIKHVGKPRVVVLNVYDLYLDGSANNHYGDNVARISPYRKNELELTVRGENGKLEQIWTPIYGKNPKLWRAVVEGCQQRLAKLGLEKHQIMLGQSTDTQASKETVDCFSAIDPEMRWTAWTHGYGYRGGAKPGQTYGLNGNRMGLMSFPDLRTNPLRGPGRCVPVLPGPDTVIVFDAMRMFLIGWEQMNVSWRLAPDLSADSGYCGYGPIGLDLWPLPPFVPTAEEKSQRKFRQGGAWSLKGFVGGNLDRGQPGACTVAGPEGALSTTRLEALAEGACETEARLCTEAAIAAKKFDAVSAQPILVARYKGFNKEVTDDKTGKPKIICDIGSWSTTTGDVRIPADWNESLAALYELAGKAQQAMNEK
ncbi:MAG: glycoside hydrolase domain-containing protein [Thermoguttaceae bacterium]